MSSKIPGLQHVTAIASDPQRNLDFYVGLLGLRFVKRTVNFDDPGSYHFYFGDRRGSPGTLLTFFPGFQRQAMRGAGQIVSGLDLDCITLCENDPEPTARLLGILGFTSTSVEGNRHRFELPGGAARV